MRRSDIAASAETSDLRVSAAHADRGAALAVLFTFSIEIASARRVEFQQIVAVLSPVSGPPAELATPESWMRLAAPDRAADANGVWQRLFACWVPKRKPQVEKIASAAMHRVAAGFAASQGDRADRDTLTLQRWLRLRADDICGIHVPQTADLFGMTSTLPNWKTLSAPLDRLAAFAADPDNPLTKRREANSAVALFQCRGKERAACVALSPPTLRPVGMLLLVPDAVSA